MAKPYLGAELEQSGLGGWHGSFGCDSELFSASPDQRRFTDRIRRGEQHESSGVEWEDVELAAIFALDVFGRRRRARRGESPRELVGRRPPSRLEQRERIPARFGDDPVPHL